MRPSISDILAIMRGVLKASDFTVEFAGSNLGYLTTGLAIKYTKAGRSFLITFVATLDSIAELEDMPGRTFDITVKRVDLPTIETKVSCESSVVQYSYDDPDVVRVTAEFIG